MIYKLPDSTAIFPQVCDEYRTDSQQLTSSIKIHTNDTQKCHLHMELTLIDRY